MTDLEMFRIIAGKENLNQVRNEIEHTILHYGNRTFQFSTTMRGVLWTEFVVDHSDWEMNNTNTFIIIAKYLFDDYMEFVFSRETGEILASDSFSDGITNKEEFASCGVIVGEEAIKDYIEKNGEKK